MHIPWEVNSIGPGNHLNGTFRGIGIVAVKQDVPWRVEKVLIHQVCLVIIIISRPLRSAGSQELDIYILSVDLRP